MTMIHPQDQPSGHRDATEPDGPDGTSGDQPSFLISGDAIMRSYVLTAALAATLLSTSLTLGHAASPTKPATGFNAEVAAADQTPTHKVYRPKPVAYRVMPPGSRLSKIDSELGAASRRIDADRHHGSLTAMELKRVRSEERAIRTAAMATAHRNGGRLPEAKFVSLQERVTDLNRMIHRYANNSARA
jgi:hypothetical protein